MSALNPANTLIIQEIRSDWPFCLKNNFLTKKVLKRASGGGGGQPEFLSTHPLPDTRIRRVSRILEEDYAQEVADPNRIVGEVRFQREILPMLRRLSEAGRDRPLTEGEKLLMASTDRGCWCAGCASKNAETAHAAE